LNGARGKWDTAASISNQFKGFDVSDSVSDVLNNQTKKLADQVIDTVTGSDVAALFKDNVFVNQAGELFALGGGTPLESVANKALTTLKTGDLTSVGGIDVSGITGNIPIGNIASVGDLKATTNVFKNVVAGQVTSSVTSTAISAVAGQARSFLTGLGGGSTARELARIGGLNTASTLGLKIGSISLPSFLGGSVGGAIAAIGSLF
jgi:hypothetical protein